MCALIAVPHDKADEYLTHNSQDFHAHMGYRLVGAFDRCAQKFGRWYDMCWMELVLAERTPQPTQTNLVPRPPQTCHLGTGIFWPLCSVNPPREVRIHASFDADGLNLASIWVRLASIRTK